jgi:hypothetical protein
MRNWTWTSLVLLVLLCFAGHVDGQEIHQALAGQQAKLHFPVADLPAGIVGYRIQYQSRKLASGTAVRKTLDERDVAMVEILVSETFASPLQAEIVLECDGKQKSASLTLFPAKPFGHLRNVLSHAKIQLFDPNGDTLKVFESHNIPFEEITSIDSISKDSNLIVIGEQCEQISDPEFTNSLFKAASRINVLCLRPAVATIDLTASPHQILFGQSAKEVTHANLDGFLAPSLSWRPTRNGETLRLEAVENSLGWPWIKIANHHSEQPSSSIAFTGLPLIEMHAKVPAARHILSKLLEHQIKSISDRKENDVFKIR